MKQPSAIEQQTFQELADIANIDPSDRAPENRQYKNVLALAGRFIDWTAAVELDPVVTHRELVYDPDSKSKFKTTGVKVEAPRIAKVFSKKKVEQHAHDEHHDYEYPDDEVVRVHVHEHEPHRNLILPIISLRKKYIPQKSSFRDALRLWPVYDQTTGLPPFVTNQIWYVGQKVFSDGSARPGVYDNANGRIKTGPGMNFALLPEYKPPGKHNIRTSTHEVPDPISATSILRAAARYATERNLDHTKF